MLTFERVVSIADYENFARTFPGVGKARADLLWIDGASQVHLTVAGATGGELGADILPNLIDAIRGASDPTQRFVASAFTQRYFTCEARIVIDPRHITEVVLAEVEAHLRAAFAFEVRDFGQSVTGAEVSKLIHDVSGVIAVDLEVLTPYGDEAPTESVNNGTLAVPARSARWDSVKRQIEPAELLLINPVGIHLEELNP